MRLDRLTVKSREALMGAEGAGRRRGHQEVDSAHLLLALLDQEQGTCAPLLEQAGINLARLRRELDRALERRPKVQGGDTLLGRDLKETLDRASAHADQLKDDYVSTEHFLLAMAEAPRSAAGQVLAAPGSTWNSCALRWSRCAATSA